jgi:hypothetical protein
MNSPKGYVEVPEFVPGEAIDTDDVGELQSQLAEARRVNAALRNKIGQAVATNAVDDGTDQVHGNVDVVEQEQDVVQWRDPSNLEMPAPRAGFVQRLVRTSFRTGQDPSNVSRAFREGWRPRKLDTVAKEDLPPTILHGTHGECIGVEGLILCEMPVSIARQRAKFYRGMTAVQTEAIEKDIHKEERPGMPIIAERRSRVSTGRRPNSED